MKCPRGEREAGVPERENGREIPPADAGPGPAVARPNPRVVQRLPDRPSEQCPPPHIQVFPSQSGTDTAEETGPSTAGTVPYHHHTMRGQAAAPWGCLTKSPHMLYGLGLKGTPQSSAFSFLPDPYFLFQWEEHVRQTPPQGLCPLGVAL